MLSVVLRGRDRKLSRALLKSVPLLGSRGRAPTALVVESGQQQRFSTFPPSFSSSSSSRSSSWRRPSCGFCTIAGVPPAFSSSFSRCTGAEAAWGRALECSGQLADCLAQSSASAMRSWPRFLMHQVHACQTSLKCLSRCGSVKRNSLGEQKAVVVTLKLLFPKILKVDVCRWMSTTSTSGMTKRRKVSKGGGSVLKQRKLRERKRLPCTDVSRLL
mmetsp:Transcript_8107/g.34102  ORF Transcript_8107/g.34102 Transcript_8107/m.34102 type:complete len:216 (-) Transcript_8107:783-1430(-)